MRQHFRLLTVSLMLGLSAPARADIPEPVRAMIAEAIESGDQQAVATVIGLAKKTMPAETDALETIHANFRAKVAEHAEAAKADEIREIRSAGLFERWTGTGEIGGIRSTGSTDTLGLTGAVSVDRRGIDWRHKVTARADLQRTDGRTTREKYFAAYEPRYDVSEGIFAYGLAQFDRDRFQGYDARYAISGGVGAALIDTESLDLSLKAGPALRITETTDGQSDTRLAGFVGLDLGWRITQRLKLTQGTNAVTETGGAVIALIDSRSTTVNLVTALEAKVSDRLSTRFSYAVDYDSNPPAGRVGTDTISRFSFVYGF